MENVAQIITQPEMVFVFVSIILLVALRPLYQSIFSIRMVNHDLDMATHVLTQLGKNQQDEFYDQFKTINGQILRIRGLRHAWREFVDSMYFESATLPNTHKKAYLSHRPSHYFNRDSVLGTRLNLSQFLAYPNYLIGIGLTLTFIGLAAALHVAQAGLANGAGQQALKDLLAVASVKFISSIAGIASSLVISALQRIRIRIFQQKLDTFCDLLEECTKYKSTEKLLHDSFSEQRRQTILLNDMAKNIAIGINDVISNQLSNSVVNALEPLTHEIKSLAQNFAEGSEEALRKMLTEFLNGLHKNSSNEIQGLMDSVRILKESLAGLAGNMESVGKNFDSDTKISTARVAEVVKDFAASFAPVQLSIVQFGRSLSSLEAISGKIEQAGANIYSAADNNKKTASEFEEVITDISAKLAPVAELLASLSRSLSNVEETALNLKQAGGTIATAAEGFKASATLIDRSEGKFSQKVQIFETVAQGISVTIATMERISRQLNNVSTALKKTEGSYIAKLKSRWLK